MKRAKTSAVIIGLLCLGIVGMALFFRLNEVYLLRIYPPPQNGNFPISSAIPTAQKVVYKDKDYLIYLVKIPSDKNISLIPNFSERKSSLEIVKDNSCAFAINGSFYTKDNKALGYFALENKTLNSTIHNPAFLNGMLINKNNRLELTHANKPTEQLDFALQSGPYLTKNSSRKFSPDEYERRVFVAKNDLDEFFFGAAVIDGESFAGPLLSELFEVVTQTNTEITDVLNLDGGSAAFFYENGINRLSEIVPVGSVLCVSTGEK